MATLVSDPVRYVATEWEHNCGYKSAVLSGIVPDKRHLDNGGYHVSVEDLRKYGNETDYSNSRPDDRNLNVRFGAAIDMSMSPADMRKCHDRVRKVWADKSDPRRQYLNAVNSWDGSGDAVRLDVYAGTAKFATADHKWHNHLEFRRRYVLSMVAARAIVSVLRGESKAAYLASLGQKPAAPTAPKGVFDGMSDEKVIELVAQGVQKALTTPMQVPGKSADRLGGKGWATKISLWTVLGAYGYEHFIDGRPVENTAQLRVEVAALRGLLEGLAAGGGNPEIAAILARVDERVGQAVDVIKAEVRDAVADLGEGGAEQVRADAAARS
ncbi:hypothetical protein AB0F93_00025 [Micromonospora tulbaghiae]|uniref:hypothetical protein n=1 Tax=Micromonospora tulbaghiae TaxID=479978 RepID=UPI00332AAA1D